ncbi:MAG TPA: non-ribosomal peptide synthetase [Bryobacteraceae bacterium]|nr:non-ribosomal peptide synthetase [Bryobacteraceae bacterium]
MTARQVFSNVRDAVVARAGERPDARAVGAGGKNVTYAELNNRANRMAQFLRSQGVGRETLVGVCLPRSVELVSGMLGIWKAGGTYLPLDPTNPADRLASILENARPMLVLTTRAISRKLAIPGCRLVDSEAAEANIESAEPVTTDTDCGDLAYVIYTSGSTGVPKGVEITHQALANLVAWHNEAFSVGAADRASHLAGLGFDASGWELWPYLAAGASVHLVDDATRNSPEALRDWLVAEGITISFVPTPLAERMLVLAWPAETHVRILLTGGDTLHHYPPVGLPFEVVNNYGPTECTVVATSAAVPPEKGYSALPAIGRAIANTEIYILNENLQPAPAGSPGEICIAGPSLARGYRNLPNLTAEKFVEVRLESGAATRIYRTGDLGMLLPDGQIEYRGRLDDQIKIRGYRIEPNEIISRLNEHPDVRESLVLAREDPSGEKRLVAYVVLAARSEATDGALIEFLRAALPDYMIPSVFVRMGTLPLTANGKIDRTALPAPKFEKAPGAEGPQTPVEQSIGGMLAKLLNVQSVGRNDNFFLLGGHSLLGAQLIARIRNVFGVEISLRALFEAPTIAALAAEVEQRRGAHEAELSSASSLP